MTVALITEGDANPGETEYLSDQGIKVLCTAGPEITVHDGQVQILAPFVATHVTDVAAEPPEELDGLRVSLARARSCSPGGWG